MPPFASGVHKHVMLCSGLLHISNMTHGKLRSVADVLKVGETVKALVIKSTPDRIALRYNIAKV
jgi:predicted RNA-binding protein with RPS1 domain